MSSALIAFSFAFSCSLGIYLLTTSDSVSGGDSGELMVAAQQLATPHPPGMPSFVLLYHGMYQVARLFDSSSSGGSGEMSSTVQPALVFNSFSCLLSALGVGFLAAAGTLFTRGCAPAGVATSFVIAFSPTYFQYAKETEVFALHNFFVALLLLLFLRYEEAHRSRYAAAVRSGEQRRKLASVASMKKVVNDKKQQLQQQQPHAVNEKDGEDLDEYELADRELRLDDNESLAAVAQRPLLRSFVGAFFCGLASTNQHTAVLLVVPLALWVTVSELGFLSASPVRLLICVIIYTLCFIIGLTPYAFLYTNERWRAMVKNPTLIAWGNTSTVQGFVHHFLRWDYGSSFTLGSHEANYLVRDAWRTWYLFLKDCQVQFSNGIFAPLPLISVCFALLPAASTSLSASAHFSYHIGFRAMERRVTTCVLLSWLTYTIFFHQLSNLPLDQPLFVGVQQRFWMHPFTLLAFLCAPAFAFLARKTAGPRAALAQWWLPLLVLAVQLGMHYGSHDESRNTYTESFGRAVLAQLPARSMLLTRGDLVINSVRAVQSLSGFRSDVVVLDQELLTFSWYTQRARAVFPGVEFPGDFYHPGRSGAFDMLAFVRANKRRFPRIFFAYGVKDGDDSAVKAGLQLRAAGLASELVEDSSNNKKLATVHEISEKDALQWMSELMLCFGAPLPGASIDAPDAILYGMYNASSRSGSLSSNNPVSSDLQAPASFEIRSSRYPDSAWETVVAVDVSSAMQRASFTLHSLADRVRNLLQGGATGAAAESQSLLPADTFTLAQLRDVCGRQCVQGKDAASWSGISRPEESKHRAPFVSWSTRDKKCSEARTVALCSLHFANAMLQEVERRWPWEAHSSLYRNHAAILQSISAFTAAGGTEPGPGKTPQMALNGMIADSLRRYVDKAQEEKIDPAEISKMKAAIAFFDNNAK